MINDNIKEYIDVIIIVIVFALFIGSFIEVIIFNNYIKGIYYLLLSLTLYSFNRKTFYLKQK